MSKKQADTIFNTWNGIIEAKKLAKQKLMEESLASFLPRITPTPELLSIASQCFGDARVNDARSFYHCVNGKRANAGVGFEFRWLSDKNRRVKRSLAEIRTMWHRMNPKMGTLNTDTLLYYIFKDKLQPNK